VYNPGIGMAQVGTVDAPRTYGRWLALGAVVVPLGFLLVLQLRTLAELEETSALSHRMTLKTYAKAVRDGAEDFYRQKARAALGVPASLLASSTAALASHFAAQDGRGVKHFFAMPFAGNADGRILFFDAEGRAVSAPGAEEARAVRFAAAPWRLAAEEATEIESAPAVVDEHDPDNRVILEPIVGGDSRVVGVAGMVLDAAFFHHRYLPERMESEMALFPQPLRDHVAVSVGRVAPADGGQPPPPENSAIEVPFRFVFTDSTLVVRSDYAAPGQWARWRFATNVALSLVLAAAVLAAVALSLRSAARATKLSQMKTEFVSSVSHELRTPLASIRVFGELMRLGRVTEPPKVREYGEYIESESRRLTQLVDNILDFSEIESGRKRYRFEKASLSGIVNETLEGFSARLRKEGFSVEVRAPSTPLPPAWADRAALTLVLTNLLDNAIKYSGDKRRIGIDFGQQNGSVSVTVSDEGPGIEVEEQERIFEKFYRVSNGLVHDVKGSGLGLAIVRHVVQAHSGTVTVRSRPGAGSSFTVELPTHGA
jgi:signal transduction histidine kinase